MIIMKMINCLRFYSVPTFEASKYLITNKEFLEFIEAGGYNKADLWTEEGWKWKNYRKSKHPMFWICKNGELATKRIMFRSKMIMSDLCIIYFNI